MGEHYLTSIMTAFSGNLKVKICEAKDLQLTERMKRYVGVAGVKSPLELTLDPYVILEVNERQMHKTQVYYILWFVSCIISIKILDNRNNCLTILYHQYAIAEYLCQ